MRARIGGTARLEWTLALILPRWPPQQSAPTIRFENWLSVEERFLATQLLQHLPGLFVAGMQFEQFDEHGPRFFRCIFYDVYAGQVQVGLIECRRHADAFLKTRDRFIAPMRAQIKNAEVVECFGIIGPQFQRLLQTLESPR